MRFSLQLAGAQFAAFLFACAFTRATLARPPEARILAGRTAPAEQTLDRGPFELSGGLGVAFPKCDRECNADVGAAMRASALWRGEVAGFGFAVAYARAPADF